MFFKVIIFVINNKYQKIQYLLSLLIIWNFKIYKKFNKDLQKFNDSELQKHFNIFGKNEDRIYNLKTLIEKNIHLIYFDLDTIIKIIIKI